MKRIGIITAFLCLCTLAGAQTRDALSFDRLGNTPVETNIEKNIWFASNNASLMAVRPLASYGKTSLDYDLEKGKFKLQQQGDRVRNISFNAEGAAKVGRYAIWGEFHFNNITTDSTRFNTDLYDPFDCMPYYVADPNRSYWSSQSYEMKARMASPFYWEKLSFGVEVSYVAQTAGKQVDPRGNPFKYNITVVPSLTYALNDNSFIGVHGYFRDSYEISSSSNQNYSKDQKVFVLKGLGNFATAFIGGVSGLGRFYWKGDRYGGGLQYALRGDVDLLVDADAELLSEDCYQSPSMPRIMGSTSQMRIAGKAALMFGERKSNKFTAEGFYRSTDGTEYITKFNEGKGIKSWEILNQSVCSNYTKIYGNIAYDHWFGSNAAGEGYVWKVGAEAAFDSENDEYYVPSAKFNYMNAFFGVNARRSFVFGRCNLAAGVEGGYRMNLGGEYTYTASDAATAVTANVWYPLDLAYYKADCAVFGADIFFGYRVSKRITIYLKGNGSYNTASLPETITCPNGTTVGLYGNSRITASGSLGLYF